MAIKGNHDEKGCWWGDGQVANFFGAWKNTTRDFWMCPNVAGYTNDSGWTDEMISQWTGPRGRMNRS